MSAFRKTMVYLGLVEETDEDFGAQNGARGNGQATATAAAHGGTAEIDLRDDGGEGVVAVHSGGSSSVPANVRPLRVKDRVTSPAAAEVAVVSPRSFNEVEQVAARFRAGQSVIADLSGANDVDSRRILDFVSGAVYVARGSLAPAGGRAFLLLAEDATVSGEERDRLRGLGYEIGTAGSSRRGSR